MAEELEPKFEAGDRVRVRCLNVKGHNRTPWFLRGKVGRVERCHGAYPNPESLAHGGDGLPRQPLYRVRLRQTDLWPEYSGNPADTLLVDIYQHWLEAA